MVLELIIIGGVVWYYAKKHKENKLKKAAFLANQPFYHKNGSVTYPPGYPGLPAYSPREGEMVNEKVQIPIQDDSSYSREHGYYRDAPATVSRDEKAPLMVETREVMGEKN